ncbi:MAG: hypothetical protein LQ340_004066 [Diploschistes diacapsis]|nr:MAG: hypothetical protein LQ340_004066 [Diploschistes diacapsis]
MNVVFRYVHVAIEYASQEPQLGTDEEKESPRISWQQEEELHHQTRPRAIPSAALPSPTSLHPFTLPLLLPHISPSHFHTSLSSFLAYASRTGLSPTTTVFKGTKYEYICLSSLQRFGFSLLRTGGANDVGIDLMGTWTLPTSAHPLRVLVQCKFRRAKPSPVLVRELEGSFIGGPQGWRDEDYDSVESGGADAGLVGVLCVPGEPTTSVRQAVRRSLRGIVVAVISEEGQVKQFFWNKRVEELALEEWEVGGRYLGGLKDREAVLLWRGRIWEPEEEGQEQKEAGTEYAKASEA